MERKASSKSRVKSNPPRHELSTCGPNRSSTSIEHPMADEKERRRKEGPRSIWAIKNAFQDDIDVFYYDTAMLRTMLAITNAGTGTRGHLP
jgi:hypothetical protein